MLNALCRYVPVATALDAIGDPATMSVLDVGCGRTGLARVLPEVPFVRLEARFDAPRVDSMLRSRPHRALPIRRRGVRRRLPH